MGLEYRDMEGMIKPTVFVDEFKSKVGDDDAYIVLSFYVHNQVVAEDMVQWFESGYEWVIDADRSPGEIEPNRYLVFVEIKRRTQIIEQLTEMLEDFETLTEFTLEDWTVTFEGNEFPVDEALADVLILSPQTYRETHEMELNEMRMACGIPTKAIYRSKADDVNAMRELAQIPTQHEKTTDEDLKRMQRNARII